MNVEVTKYRKTDGYATRYWSVSINGELLAVTLYRKGAEAVARAITNPNKDLYASSIENSSHSFRVSESTPTCVETAKPR
jgi:hypothetical protein